MALPAAIQPSGSSNPFMEWCQYQTSNGPSSSPSFASACPSTTTSNISSSSTSTTTQTGTTRRYERVSPLATAVNARINAIRKGFNDDDSCHYGTLPVPVAEIILDYHVRHRHMPFSFSQQVILHSTSYC
jgi:hypothetical protein